MNRIHPMRLFYSVISVPILSVALFALSISELVGQSIQPGSPLMLELTEEEGIDRNREPVEVELRLIPGDGRSLTDIIENPSTAIRVSKLTEGSEQEIPVQLFDLRLSGSGSVLHAKLLFFAEARANEIVRYRVEKRSPDSSFTTDLQVQGKGVERVIENQHFRIITDPVSGQINQIDLTFADRPSFRFEPGNMHWNPDFIIVPDDYPERSYTWPAARNMEHPEYEIETGPLFFTLTRRQFIPGQKKVFLEVRYRFYAGLPWFLMESRMEAVREFRTFGIRNDELAFGIADFTHAGWRTESLGLHPRHRGEVGTIPLYDETRPGRHILGSALSAWLPWLSYSHNERGYGVATLRLGWDNRNLLTGDQSPLVNSRTVLSSNNGAPYWFRSLVYTPRRANDEAFFNLDQETINEMVQRIPRGSSYYERNVYYFYPFDLETSYEPVDTLYLKLTRPLQIRFYTE